jgi:hypothetical protein
MASRLRSEWSFSMWIPWSARDAATTDRAARQPWRAWGWAARQPSRVTGSPVRAGRGRSGAQAELSRLASTGPHGPPGRGFLGVRGRDKEREWWRLKSSELGTGRIRGRAKILQSSVRSSHTGSSLPGCEMVALPRIALFPFRETFSVRPLDRPTLLFGASLYSKRFTPEGPWTRGRLCSRGSPTWIHERTGKLAT